MVGWSMNWWSVERWLCESGNQWSGEKRLGREGKSGVWRSGWIKGWLGG